MTVSDELERRLDSTMDLMQDTFGVSYGERTVGLEEGELAAFITEPVIVHRMLDKSGQVIAMILVHESAAEALGLALATTDNPGQAQ